jgi:hypothetical protein
MHKDGIKVGRIGFVTEAVGSKAIACGVFMTDIWQSLRIERRLLGDAKAAVKVARR